MGSWDTYFYALNAGTGAEVWRFKTGDDPSIHNQVGIQSSATVVNGMVYFGCRDSKFYALDAATGKQIWMFPNKGSWVITSPVVQNGKVYMATSDTALLHALDAKTGESIYSIQYHWPIFASPSIAGSTLYVAGQDGKLVAIDLMARKQMWEFQTEGSRKNLAALSKPDGSPDYQGVFAANFYDDIVAGIGEAAHRGDDTFFASCVGERSLFWERGWESLCGGLANCLFRLGTRYRLSDSSDLVHLME